MQSTPRSEWREALQTVAEYVPSLIGALAILVVGWLVALIVARLVHAALARTRVGERMVGWVTGTDRPQGVGVEGTTSRIAFWLIMLFVLVAFFQALGLTLVTEPLNSALSSVLQFVPRLVGAAVLLLVGLAVATGLRAVVTRGLKASKLDEKLGTSVDTGKTDLAATLGDTVFWLALLLFLPAILGALALEGIMTPVQGMLTEVLDFLPNLFAAALILLGGWLLARVVQRVVTSLLVSVGAEAVSERVGLAKALGEKGLSRMLGLVVYVLILIPMAVAALNALQLEAISAPASDMLKRILAALPNVFGALVVVAFAYVIGKLVAGLVANLLTGVGFNVVLTRLGLAEEPDDKAEVEGRTPSEVVGFLVLVAVMLVAGIEASRLLGFELLAELISEFYVFAGKVLLGLVIFALGLLVAKLVHAKVSTSGASNARLLALAARTAILVLVGAMAVQHMGIAAEVINLVLAIGLGAVAVALALAFGLGAREPAGKLVEDWTAGLRKKP